MRTLLVKAGVPHTYAHTNAHTRAHTHTHTSTYTLKYIHLHTHTHIVTYTHTQHTLSKEQESNARTTGKISRLLQIIGLFCRIQSVL